MKGSENVDSCLCICICILPGEYWVNSPGLAWAQLILDSGSASVFLELGEDLDARNQ